MRISDAEALGILVVAQLDLLYSEEDKCCVDCCAPCNVIRQLAGSDDDLEQIIAAAPEHLASPWINAGGVDRVWLASRWDCTSNPRCKEDPVPGCPGQFHGADGGACTVCGWDSHAIA